MPEITQILITKREKDYEDKKFLAAMQGVNLDENNKSSDGKERGQKEWEDMKARVFSGGRATDSNDVISLQGSDAQKAGIGIGLGLDYAVVSDDSGPKNPMG